MSTNENNPIESAPVAIFLASMVAIANTIRDLWEDYRWIIFSALIVSLVLATTAVILLFNGFHSTNNWGNVAAIFIIACLLSFWSAIFKKISYWQAVWLAMGGLFLAAGINKLFENAPTALANLWIFLPALAFWKGLIQKKIHLTGRAGKIITTALSLVVIVLVVTALFSWFSTTDRSGARVTNHDTSTFTGAVSDLTPKAIRKVHGILDKFINGLDKPTATTQAAPRPVVYKTLEHQVGMVPPRYTGHFRIRGVLPAAPYTVIDYAAVPMNDGSVQWRQYGGTRTFPPSKLRWRSANTSAYRMKVVVRYMSGHFMPNNVVQTENEPLDP